MREGLITSLPQPNASMQRRPTAELCCPGGAWGSTDAAMDTSTPAGQHPRVSLGQGGLYHNKLSSMSRNGLEISRSKHSVSRALGMLVARIEHIGSTPVLGLPAKPIIDIQIIVQNETAAQQRQPILVEHGYSEAVAPIRFFHQPAGWPDVITCIYEKTATPRRAGRACFVIGSGRTRGNA
jgi:hypothetical protein